MRTVRAEFKNYSVVLLVSCIVLKIPLSKTKRRVKKELRSVNTKEVEGQLWNMTPQSPGMLSSHLSAAAEVQK